MADTLVNIGIKLNCDFVLFNEPPREILASLYADQVGVKSPRSVVNQ